MPRLTALMAMARTAMPRPINSGGETLRGSGWRRTEVSIPMPRTTAMTDQTQAAVWVLLDNELSEVNKAMAATTATTVPGWEVLRGLACAGVTDRDWTGVYLVGVRVGTTGDVAPLLVGCCPYGGKPPGSAAIAAGF
ncbi:MAG: hypothetical protein ACR2I1_11790, partial [Propionibacteriaceae bacterium]